MATRPDSGGLRANAIVCVMHADVDEDKTTRCRGLVDVRPTRSYLPIGDHTLEPICDRHWRALVAGNATVTADAVEFVPAFCPVCAEGCVCKQWLGHWEVQRHNTAGKPCPGAGLTLDGAVQTSAPGARA